MDTMFTFVYVHKDGRKSSGFSLRSAIYNTVGESEARRWAHNVLSVKWENIPAGSVVPRGMKRRGMVAISKGKTQHVYGIVYH